ncbi:hypothetical protein PILCRDRAFT_824098 [Piloderma croceum F 1598]|uniref:TOG domain-containing protein n=1 Tax=Piloderma croceum (strain F 1598) TaxID=765440 RepID=A0A0C3AY80_PILCF|nr:hypothetical protein PILCRDRAFT_824098 [Piloderma croceum F 1598]
MAATKCDSPNTLKQEVDALRPILALVESEESWDTIAKGIIRFTSLCKNGACDFSAELTPFIRTVSRPISSAMCSERSRLSGAAIDLLCALASGLGAGFEPLMSLFFPTLLHLCTRTNKVLSTRARSCILAVIEHTQLPAILSYLSEASKDKSVSLRIAAAESVLACLNCFNPPDLEKEARAKLIEDVIRASARDASADVRKISRKVFEAYKALLPGRVDKFVAPLTPVMKKYLDINVKPSAPINTSRPQPHMGPAPPSVPFVTGQLKSGGTSGPSRPPSAATKAPPKAPPKAADKPSRFPAPSGPPTIARRVGHPTTALPAKVISGGASRLNRAVKDPKAGEGPIRPVVGDTENKTRVVGGARRVPLPPSTIQDVDRAAAASLQPTLAQLSRAKAAAVDRKGKDAVKPSWGRPPPSKAAIVTKGVSTGGKVQDMKPGSRPKHKGKTAPTDIPLPPSPKHEKTPTSVPLPASPKPPKNEQETEGCVGDVEGVLVPAMDEDKAVPTCAQVPAVPFIPDIKEPADSTPTRMPIGAPAGTPISTLLTSIQQGFLFTPCSPLSPPQTYLPLTAAEIDSPTPMFTRPGETQLPADHPSDHPTTQADDDVGKQISELMPALEEEAKAPRNGDKMERQVLVEVNQ